MCLATSGRVMVHESRQMTSEAMRLGEFCAQVSDHRSVGGVRAVCLLQMSDALECLGMESIKGIA